MRPDRGSKTRAEQTMADLTEMLQSHNAQSFTSLARTRLCVGCVSKETRLLTESLVDEIVETEPEVAFYCVPPCIYRGACKEVGFTECNYFNKFLESLPTDEVGWIMGDIDERYEAYHRWRKNSI